MFAVNGSEQILTHAELVAVLFICKEQIPLEPPAYPLGLRFGSRSFVFSAPLYRFRFYMLLDTSESFCRHSYQVATYLKAQKLEPVFICL